MQRQGMQTRCQAVLFDMDDVLCAYHWRARVEALSRLSGKSFETLDALIWRSGFEDDADRGVYSADAYLAGFAARLGIPFSRQDWIDNRRAAMEPFPAMLALVQQLKAAGAPIGILTNNGLLTAEAIDELFPALRPIFGKHIYVSASLGMVKPDPDIYRAACAHLGVEPQETFFTDDLAINAEGAARAGLLSHVFTGAPALRLALQDAGLPA